MHRFCPSLHPLVLTCLSSFLSPSLIYRFSPLLQDNLTSATLPRNYKVSPLATDRRSDIGSYRRSMGSAGPSGTLPRSWQPVSRIPMPPSSPQPRNTLRQRPIPLSMIFKLQNAFWEHGASRAVLPGSPIFSRAPPPKLPPQPPPQPPTQAQPQMPPQPQAQAQPQTPAPQQTWPPVNEGESAERVPAQTLGTRAAGQLWPNLSPDTEPAESRARSPWECTQGRGYRAVEQSLGRLRTYALASQSLHSLSINAESQYNPVFWDMTLKPYQFLKIRQCIESALCPLSPDWQHPSVPEGLSFSLSELMTCCVTQDKSLYLSGPVFPTCEKSVTMFTL